MDEHDTLFYDGECGLCDRFTQLVLRHDREDRFRFAALQSDYARAELGTRGVDLTAGPLLTVYVLTRDGRLLDRADAALFVLRALPELRTLGRIASLFPAPLRRLGYDFVARNRFAVFGRAEQCALPTPENRKKFLGNQGD